MCRVEKHYTRLIGLGKEMYGRGPRPELCESDCEFCENLRGSEAIEKWLEDRFREKVTAALTKAWNSL